MSVVRRHARPAALALAVLSSTPIGHSIIRAQTIRRDDIERAGWNRVSEILEGATGWARASVDGFTYSLSPDRLPAAGQSAPGMPDVVVLIDGQRIAAGMFGMQVLELLPISVGEIDSVVFTRGPAIVAGVAADRGVVRIFSRRLHRGANADVAYQHGDESGDPGPYRYTTLSSSNVEKLGPFASARAGWAAQAWELDAGVHVASLNITDTLISARFPSGTFGQLRPDVVAITPTARLAAAGFGGRHQLVASYGDQRGLLFIPTLKREQSLRLTSSRVGIDGSMSGRGVQIRYDGSSSSLDAGELRSPLAFTVGHTRRNTGGSVALSHDAGAGTLTLGARGDWWTLNADSLRGARSSGGGGPFASWRLPVGRASIDATSTLVFDGRQPGTLDVALESLVRLDSLTSIRLGGSRMRAHPSMDGTWIDAAVLGYGVRARPVLSGVNLSMSRQLGIATATIGGRGERVTDWRDVQRTPRGQTAAASDTLGHDGNFISAHLRLETTRAGVWQGAVEYDRTSIVGVDDEAFRAAIRSTPANDFRAQLSASPARDLRLSAVVSLTDGNHWTTFADSTGAVPAAPPLRRLDATMEKWMWRRRFRVELVYRNILNEAERYHPFGAQWNLRWHLSGSLAL